MKYLKYFIRAFYIISMIFLILSFWINNPFRLVGFLSLLIASILLLIARMKKK